MQALLDNAAHPKAPAARTAQAAPGNVTGAVRMAPHAPHAPELIIVKWKTPEDELVGTAKLALALVDRRIARPAQVAIAAPSRNWAAQALAAARQVAGGMTALNATATLCVRPARLDHGANAALARLDAAAPADDAARELRGRSLAHRLGLDGVPALEHALTHLEGDEDIAQLRALVHRQLERPTLAARASAVGVVLAEEVPEDVDYLFLVGCVDGLLPGRAACTEPDDHGRAQALSADRAVFRAIADAGRTRTTMSYFTQAPFELARAAHLEFGRVRREGGQMLAMCQPSRFLAEAGQQRPTTEGGQALLRKYHLN